MRYLTVPEAAESLQLSVPTIKRYIYSGKLKSTKLPGGQHRIAETEVDRLLADAAPPGGGASCDGDPCERAEQRIAVLERWVTELEAEVERLAAALEVVSRFCACKADQSLSEPSPSEAPRPHRIEVLGTGCRRCEALMALAQRVVRSMGREDVTVVRVDNVDDITAYGPILTPALTLDDEVVIAGRVPPESSLRDLLARRLGA